MGATLGVDVVTGPLHLVTKSEQKAARKPKKATPAQGFAGGLLVRPNRSRWKAPRARRRSLGSVLGPFLSMLGGCVGCLGSQRSEAEKNSTA